MDVLENKRFKDPIYGYIKVPKEYCDKIIDTAIFQRLRRVIQTSYSPLYSSAMHNRFVHSIGVFHLGSIAAECLKNAAMQVGRIQKSDAEKMAKIYQIACLLHDVGHAPFSHTGEIYYKDENCNSAKLHKRLYSLIGSDRFKNDIPSEEGDKTAPHEVMSAIVGIIRFGDLIGKNVEDKEFFARCITGYTYSKPDNQEQIKNCFISMLNSKVIDVDRLDYLIRDAYTTGYETIRIDYQRLLNALTIVRTQDGFKVAYFKDAVSIIENVVYAHDAEKKWIQNHPVVLYETYIIKHILEYLNGKLNTATKKLFSEQSISVEGHTLNKNFISLMCDDDIIFLSKNKYSDELSKEFFARQNRRHPVWKSEAEYKAYIESRCQKGESIESFVECMKSFVISKAAGYPIPAVINQDYLNKLEKNLKELQEEQEAFGEELLENTNMVIGLEKQISVCHYLKKYADTAGMPFDYIIIQTNMFNSTFSKNDLRNEWIAFGKAGNVKPKQLKDVCNILQSEKEPPKELYYLFYRKGEETEDKPGYIEDPMQFCNGLLDAVEAIDKKYR